MWLVADLRPTLFKMAPQFPDEAPAQNIANTCIFRKLVSVQEFACSL